MKRNGVAAPLAHRDFRLLWLASAISLLGDGAFVVALAWQAYAISDRPSTLALVGVATALPQVVMLLFGGAAADRFDRRRVLVAADLARFGAVGALAGLSGAGVVGLDELYAAAVVIGVATAFSSPALDAVVPDLVPADELTRANALGEGARPVTVQLLGPALGGAAVAAFGASGAFGLDAASFAASALLVSRLAPLAAPGPGGPGLRAEVAEGLRYVAAHRWLWATFLSATISYLCFIGPTEVLLPFLIRNTLHRGAGTYGLVLAAGGLGALLGAAFVAREAGRSITTIYLLWTLATLSVAGYGLATSAWGLGLAAVAVNGGEAAGAVLWSTLKQRRVDKAMLGRVSSIDWAISTALLPASYALSAPVASALGTRATLVLAGTLGAAVTLGFVFLPGLRDADVPRAGLEASAVAPGALARAPEAAPRN